MSLVGFTLLNGIYPVLFNLYLLRLDYGVELIGTINAIGMLGFALFALPSGALADRWGLRRAMGIGLILAVLANGALPLFEFLPTSVHVACTLGAQLAGSAGMALYFVNSAPFLAAAAAPEERTHAYSVRMASSTVAGFVGSLFGGTLPGLLAPILHVPLDHPAPYRYSLLGAAILCIPAVLALLAMRGAHLTPHRQAHRSPLSQFAAGGSDKVPWAPLAAMAVVMVLLAAGTGTSRTFFNVYLEDGLRMSTATIGIIFAAIQLASVPASLAMPLLAQRWGTYRTVVWTSLGSAISMLPLALIPHWAAATFGRLGVYALSSLSDPALSVYQMEAVHPRWRGVMSGISSMALGLSWTALAFSGGYMIAALGYRALFLLAAALNVGGTLLFWACFRGPAIQPLPHAIANRQEGEMP